MDDFYVEMSDVLSDINSHSSNLKDESKTTLSSSVLHSNSIFVEALVTVNPCRWAAFTAGSAADNNMPNFIDRVQTPIDNLVVAKEYLETAKSDVQWRDRAWQVIQDTLVINAVSKMGHEAGSFTAGTMSNKIAEKYMNEMIETEQLNMEIFKQEAAKLNIDQAQVRGTGVFREFVPNEMQGDICNRPERYSRSDLGIILNDGIIIDDKKVDFGSNSIFEYKESNSSSTSVFESETLSKNQDEHPGFFSVFKNIFGFGGSCSGCSTSIDTSSAYLDECEREKNNFWKWNLYN
jgi:hypothetical protein